MGGGGDSRKDFEVRRALKGEFVFIYSNGRRFEDSESRFGGVWGTRTGNWPVEAKAGVLIVSPSRQREHGPAKPDGRRRETGNAWRVSTSICGSWFQSTGRDIMELRGEASVPEHGRTPNVNGSPVDPDGARGVV